MAIENTPSVKASRRRLEKVSVFGSCLAICFMHQSIAASFLYIQKLHLINAIVVAVKHLQHKRLVFFAVGFVSAAVLFGSVYALFYRSTRNYDALEKLACSGSNCVSYLEYTVGTTRQFELLFHNEPSRAVIYKVPYDKKQTEVQFSEDGNQAVVTVPRSTITFDFDSLTP